MAKVIRKKDEELDSLLRRFRRVVNEDAILAEVKKREFYKSKSEKLREKMKANRKNKFKKKDREYIPLYKYTGIIKRFPKQEKKEE